MYSFLFSLLSELNTELFLSFFPENFQKHPTFNHKDQGIPRLT